MNLILLITYSLWFLSEILINRLLYSNKTDKQNADKGSIYILWIVILACIFGAIYISNKFPGTILKNAVIQYLGVLFIYFGIILRLIIIKSLGQFFTVDVTIRPEHKLKKDGFYKYVRHPSYSAALLSFTGFGISLNNWISLTLVIISILSAFSFRMNVEEKLLNEHFGSEYLDYKKVTKRIIPFIY